jgi:hypothetical protein
MNMGQRELGSECPDCGLLIDSKSECACNHYFDVIYSLEDDDYEDFEEIDEPCSNCGWYSHWTEDCKVCEDCKSPQCKQIGDAACKARCKEIYH